VGKLPGRRAPGKEQLGHLMRLDLFTLPRKSKKRKGPDTFTLDEKGLIHNYSSPGDEPDNPGLINTGGSGKQIKELEGDRADIESAAGLLLLHGSRSNSDNSASAQLSEGSAPRDIQIEFVKQEPHLQPGLQAATRVQAAAASGYALLTKSPPRALCRTVASAAKWTQAAGCKLAHAKASSLDVPVIEEKNAMNYAPGVAGAAKGDLGPYTSPAAGGPAVAAFTQADGASRAHPRPLGATRGPSFESALEILLGPATNDAGRPACSGPAGRGIVLEDERFLSAQVRGPGGCRTT
jgi:hypothetical protein